MNDSKLERENESGFGFNERSIIAACGTILWAYKLAPFKPYPAVYLPAGWFGPRKGRKY